jgi:hypothetical protein
LYNLDRGPSEMSTNLLVNSRGYSNSNYNSNDIYINKIEIVRGRVKVNLRGEVIGKIRLRIRIKIVKDSVKDIGLI